MIDIFPDQYIMSDTSQILGAKTQCHIHAFMMKANLNPDLILPQAIYLYVLHLI